MKSFIQFLMEGVIDKPLKFYEGQHPHETFNNYNTRFNELTSTPQTAESNSSPHFGSEHRYLDPKTGIETSIKMTHRNPNYIGNNGSGAGRAKVSIGWKPDPTNPHSPLQFGDVGRNSTFFNTQTQTTAKIDVGREHVNDFIQKMTPNGLKTITYSTPDSRRHAVYQTIAKQYPHLKFENMENIIPTKRMPIGKLGIVGAALALATGASAEDLLHGLHPLSVLGGGVAGGEGDTVPYQSEEEFDASHPWEAEKRKKQDKENEEAKLQWEKDNTPIPPKDTPQNSHSNIPKNYTY